MTDFPHDDQQPDGAPSTGSTDPPTAEHDDVPTDAAARADSVIGFDDKMSQADAACDAEPVNDGPNGAAGDDSFASDAETDHGADATDAPDPSNTDPITDDGNDGPPGPYLPPPFTTIPPSGVAAAPPIRRIYRSRHDRKLGGVSAGVAEFFRIDPTIVRLATLVFAITGVGILVYLAAWLIIPLRPESLVEATHDRPIGDERSITIAFGVAALALTFGIVTGSWAVLAVALVGGGVWLLSQHPSPVPAASFVHPPTAPTAPYAYAPQQTDIEGTPYAATGGFPPPLGYEPNDAPVRERKPQRITWTVLSLLALLTAVGIAAATGNWWDVSATRFLGAAVVIIAIGVVVGQIRGGGARGLIPIGLLAALALFPLSAVDGLLDDGVGATTYRPTTIAELESSYAHGIGQLTVDLSRLDFAGQSETIDIDLGIGELIVIVSEDTGGRAVLQAKAGEVSHQLPNTDSFLFDEGVNIETGTVVLQGDDGELELNLSVGFGTAELRSEPG